MKSAKTKRQLTLLTLVVALGVAVYLNWEYAKSDSVLLADGAAQVNANISSVQEALPDKNYGDAQLVSAGAQSSSEYFEQARLTRTKTRDDALDKLQKSLKNTSLSSEEKEALTATLSATIAGITAEGEIETLVKAKGFADCVTFIDGDTVNVTVKTGGGSLDSTSVAKIRDIVLSKLETDAKNITVVEVQ